MFDRNMLKLPGMVGVLGALAVLALLQAAGIVGQAYALAASVSLLWEGVPLDSVAPTIAAFFACFALLQLIRFAQETMLDRFSLIRARELRALLLERVFDDRVMLAHRVGGSQVANVATDGIDEVQTYLRIIPPKIVGMVAITFPVLACLFVVDWASGVICAVMFPVIMFFMVLLGRQARERSERQYESYTLLTNRFMDTLRGMRVIKSLGAANREADDAYRHSEQLRDATVKTLTVATLSSMVLDLCATFGVAAVAMMLAFRLLDGSLSLFTALFALVLAPEYFSPIRAFASDYHASLDGKNSLAAVLSLLASSGNVEACDSGSVAEAECQAMKVAFDDAAYIYEGTQSGVEHITFSAEGPQVIALVGKSGSGKTTLANLIAGFVEPTSGAASTCPVRYIPQSPYLFRATLEENIRFYNPAATRAEVESAVEAVGLDELVRELPEGLDTLVGEGERGLSGGEAHRVALARILLDDNAHVLVFDEPTAHLDIETEFELKAPMLSAMEGKLAFIATHRLHWLASVDRVIALEDGRIVSDEVVA